MAKHYVLIEFETDKPIADLADKIAGRVYTMEGIVNKNDVSAMDVTDDVLGILKEQALIEALLDD